ARTADRLPVVPEAPCASPVSTPGKPVHTSRNRERRRPRATHSSTAAQTFRLSPCLALRYACVPPALAIGRVIRRHVQSPPRPGRRAEAMTPCPNPAVGESPHPQPLVAALPANDGGS